MDPTANLEEQLRIAARILFAMDKCEIPSAEDSYCLAELVEALHNWVEAKGHLPQQWKR